MDKQLLHQWEVSGEHIKLVNANYYEELKKELEGVALTKEVFIVGPIYFVKDVSYDRLQ